MDSRESTTFILICAALIVIGIGVAAIKPLFKLGLFLYLFGIGMVLVMMFIILIWGQ